MTTEKCPECGARRGEQCGRSFMPGKCPIGNPTSKPILGDLLIGYGLAYLRVCRDGPEHVPALEAAQNAIATDFERLKSAWDHAYNQALQNGATAKVQTERAENAEQMLAESQQENGGLHQELRDTRAVLAACNKVLQEERTSTERLRHALTQISTLTYSECSSCDRIGDIAAAALEGAPETAAPHEERLNRIAGILSRWGGSRNARDMSSALDEIEEAALCPLDRAAESEGAKP